MQYLKARDDMLARADFSWAPWWVVPSDDKQSSRLNCIQHLLKSVPYENVPPEPLELPRREAPDDYKPPAKARERVVRIEQHPHASSFWWDALDCCGPRAAAAVARRRLVRQAASDLAPPHGGF